MELTTVVQLYCTCTRYLYFCLGMSYNTTRNSEHIHCMSALCTDILCIHIYISIERVSLQHLYFALELGLESLTS